MEELERPPEGLLVELNRPITSDEEAKIETFMRVRNVDRPTAMKFLLGRKMDVDRAHLLLTNYQNTVRERHFENVAITDVSKQLQTGLMYIPGTTDRNKAHLFVIDATKLDSTKFTYDDTIRLAFFMGQKVTERPQVWDNGLTLIVNMEDYTWAQWDMALQRQILSLFTDNIPARVKNILLFNPPWWISTIVRIISPFLKQKMRERLQICDKDNITNWVEKAKLPVQFGGEVQHDQEAFIQRCIEDVGADVYRQKLHLNEEGQEITAIPIERLVEVIPVPVKQYDLEPEEKEELEAERLEAKLLLEERIQVLKESSKHNHIKDHKDIYNLLRYRCTRLSLDLNDLAIFQRPQPNASESHKDPSVKPSPLAEVPGESYEPDALTKRIKASIVERIEEESGKPYEATVIENDATIVVESPKAVDVPRTRAAERDWGKEVVLPTKAEPSPKQEASVSRLVLEVEEPELTSSDAKAAGGKRKRSRPQALTSSALMEAIPELISPETKAEVPSIVVTEETAVTMPKLVEEPAASPVAGRKGRPRPANRGKVEAMAPASDDIAVIVEPAPTEDFRASIAPIAPSDPGSRESVASIRPISTFTEHPVAARDSVASIRPISDYDSVNRISVSSMTPIDLPKDEPSPKILGTIEEDAEARTMMTGLGAGKRRRRRTDEQAAAHRNVHFGGDPTADLSL